VKAAFQAVWDSVEVILNLCSDRLHRLIKPNRDWSRTAYDHDAAASKTAIKSTGDADATLWSSRKPLKYNSSEDVAPVTREVQRR
jgi:hypothetical protein